MDCPTCKCAMNISELNCEKCSLKLRGNFQEPRLARLSKEHIKLAESFIIADGNMKLLAQQMGISYPTMRRKVDEMIDDLKKVFEEDKKRMEEILVGIEQGKINAQEGLRLIRE